MRTQIGRSLSYENCCGILPSCFSSSCSIENLLRHIQTLKTALQLHSLISTPKAHLIIDEVIEEGEKVDDVEKNDDEDENQWQTNFWKTFSKIS